MPNDGLIIRQQMVALLPRLRRFALALAGRSDLAEDLLQSALERALRNLSSFERGRRLDSWMFKVIQNNWIDMKRAAATQPALTSFEGMDFVGEDGRDLIESRDELRVAREAFLALPEDQRAVIALVVLEGLSYAAASEALDVPIGTIMSRLSRARASLAARVRRGQVRPEEVRKEK